MAKFICERRPSTVKRDEYIYSVYKNIVAELGTFGSLVPKMYLYERISEKTGYCTRKIAQVVNHFRIGKSF